MTPKELLTPKEMYQADAQAARSGIAPLSLMENAGAGVTAAILQRWWPRPVLVLCGPGNNGGDGYVIARHLAARGWPVEVCALGDPSQLSGDAAIMARRWQGPVVPPPAVDFASTRLIVDCLFGAGLTRAPKGEAADLIARANASPHSKVSVDLPSGLDGLTGAVRGIAITADLTVTFFRRKPGHLLMPGRTYCGEVICVPIGIPDDVLKTIAPDLYVNGPCHWRCNLSTAGEAGHKYDRGMALVISGGEYATGASRLAARGAAGAGAGLVRIAGPAAGLAAHAAHVSSIMLAPIEAACAVSLELEDRRYRAVCIGPAAGVDGQTRAKVRAVLGSACPAVLDADALTAFEAQPDELFEAIKTRCSGARADVVLTPHDGEFARLFPELADVPDKVARARSAADQAGAVVVLKGPDTVIAAPDGHAMINHNAPAWLAKAGSGDVLTGVITGLLAQGSPAFEAAAAGVWLHGEAACLLGPGMAVDELPDAIPCAKERVI